MKIGFLNYILLYGLTAVCISVFTPREALSYAVLSHEAIIDAAWDNSILPLLKDKFPGATTDQLNDAHAYSYGGAIMPDMGYFPFGNLFFTDLVHYVRTGDFVINLLSEAQDLNELAFALGALAHYNADKNGHPGAVNVSVGKVYPKVGKEFGDTIYYEEDRIAHTRMEFGFDVAQVARGKYAPKSFHDFIGFEVSQPLLERAFVLTYGMELKDVYKDLPVAINSFRWSVKTFLPYLTNAAWASKKIQIQKLQPGITRKQFTAKMSRAEYQKEWGKNYKRPGIGAYGIALMIKVFPKVGLARILKFKLPTPEAEALFIKSFDHTVSDYSGMLKKYKTGSLHLVNIDYDTGRNTEACEYKLADDTYKKLLLQLYSSHSVHISRQLRKNLLDFYHDIPPTVKNEKQEKEYLDAITWLKSDE
ncbi:MAG: zinc dependent phospholipase C family protein [Chitinophagales bacterium]